MKNYFKISTEGKKRIVIAVIFLLIGGIIGAGIGATATLNWGVDKAIYFLDIKGYELDINKKEIINAIRMYRHEIDWRYP